jgi:hypothetical protein
VSARGGHTDLRAESRADRRLVGHVAGPGGSSLTGLGALLLILVAAALGGAVDLLTGSGLRLAFAVGLVLGSAAATALVRRTSLLTVVVAPPLIYLLASALSVLVTGGLGGTGLYDAAAGWLVYGFPAIATATGVAVVIAGIRLAGGGGPPQL